MAVALTEYAKGRIIIATFATNIHRIQQAIDAAVMYGKRVILCGKSIVSNAQIALDLGYLRIPKNTWLRLEDLNKLRDNEVVIITTGSQVAVSRNQLPAGIFELSDTHVDGQRVFAAC